MQTWLIEMNRGRRALMRHRPVEAITHFEKALLKFPTARRSSITSVSSNRRELARVHYFLGLSFRRAGMRNRAVGSWVEAGRLEKRSAVRRKLATATNAYGMAQQSNCQADDKHAFYGIQLSRYIRSKRSHKLGTRAEIDMVAELIDEHWDQIRSSRVFTDMSSDEKMRLFGETLIVFPFLSVPGALQNEDVAVDFLHGRRIDREDHCVCGSGLPYKVCCGRIPGIDEDLSGTF